MALRSEKGPQDLDAFRDYLILLAKSKLSPELGVKISPSDVVQETLLHAHQQLPNFHGTTDAELAAWLRQILARRLIDALRKFRSQARDIKRERSLEAEAESSSVRLEQWLATEGSSPSDAALHEEQMFELAAALRQLPEDQRSVVEWKHVQGWTVARISEHTGKSEAAVAGLLRRGLQRLREILGAQEETA